MTFQKWTVPLAGIATSQTRSRAQNWWNLLINPSHLFRALPSPLILVLCCVWIPVTGCIESSGPTPQPFSVPVVYNVGKKPAAVVAEDMNDDDLTDLMVINTDDQTLMFFEGLGDGTFKKPFVMKTGREPVALVTADFNGDRIPDTAVCNYGDGNLSIIFGQKDGVFKMMGTVKVGKLPLAIAAGDFNGDRINDLAVTLRFDKLVILLGNGDGTFKMAEVYQASGLPAQLVVGDYNGDQHQDLAIAFNGVKTNFIRIYNGRGDGTFEPPNKFRGGHQSGFIAQDDMNLDGHPDLIISSTMTESLTIFLGDSKGGFETLPDFAAEKGPTYIVTGEFTGDKRPDLIVANRRDGTLSLLPGRGDGTFVFPHYNYPVGRHPRAIAASDFNSDGLTDLAILLYDSGVLEILMQKISTSRIAS